MSPFRKTTHSRVGYKEQEKRGPVAPVFGLNGDYQLEVRAVQKSTYGRIYVNQTIKAEATLQLIGVNAYPGERGREVSEKEGKQDRGLRTENNDTGGTIAALFVLGPAELDHLLRGGVRDVDLAQDSVTVVRQSAFTRETRANYLQGRVRDCSSKREDLHAVT
ncbi:hypothetical protein CVT25_006144 [Psilocybe cyanescens]|uniref:Uncharacterized protein n=1 Tax=Psilocybe cyanescens TaxID=93625 RepID=A0A409WYX9_PSICY|nr:hypothetical protein CVT25_006144 [Psilocybe cyanescens]